MNVKIDIQELRYILDHTPTNQNIMLTGRHGVGKSQVLTAHYAEKGMKVVSLFLGQMSDPGDLIGLPDKSGEITLFRPPYWFPINGKPIVLFLDELNRARPEVLQTIMDLALNKKLAGRSLPEGSRIIAAVNEGEEYQLTDLDPALVSRFNILRFEPTVEEWILWARKAQLDERVIAFIRDNSDWLDKDPKNNKENIDPGLDKSPDRRAWENVAHAIAGRASLGKTDLKMIAGIVGIKAARFFMSKLHQTKVVDATKMLKNFDAIVPLLDHLQLHDYQVLNEDIFNYLTQLSSDSLTASLAAINLKKYVDFLVKQHKNEVLASFANLLQQGRHNVAADFIMDHCREVVTIVMDFTATIR